MPVAGSDMKLVQTTTVATSFSTASVGGAATSTEITGSSLGECLFAMSSAASGGGDTVQYGKVHELNDHSTDQIDTYGVWLINAIDDLGVSSTIDFVSDSASDSSTYTVRVIGKNSGGSAIQEDLTLNGTSTVTTTLSYIGKVRVEYRVTSGLALGTAVGNITITHNSTTVGVLPAGAESANNEVDIGLAAAFDAADTATITDASTAPGSVSFSRPRTSGTKLTVDGGTGTMEAGETQGIWVKWTVAELMDPSARIRSYISGAGDAA